MGSARPVTRDRAIGTWYPFRIVPIRHRGVHSCHYRELPHRLFDTKLKLARDYPEHLWAEYVVVVKEERFKMASL